MAKDRINDAYHPDDAKHDQLPVFQQVDADGEQVEEVSPIEEPGGTAGESMGEPSQSITGAELFQDLAAKKRDDNQIRSDITRQVAGHLENGGKAVATIGGQQMPISLGDGGELLGPDGEAFDPMSISQTSENRLDFHGGEPPKSGKGGKLGFEDGNQVWRTAVDWGYGGGNADIAGKRMQEWAQRLGWEAQGDDATQNSIDAANFMKGHLEYSDGVVQAAREMGYKSAGRNKLANLHGAAKHIAQTAIDSGAQNLEDFDSLVDAVMQGNEDAIPVAKQQMTDALEHLDNQGHGIIDKLADLVGGKRNLSLIAGAVIAMMIGNAILGGGGGRGNQFFNRSDINRISKSILDF